MSAQIDIISERSELGQGSWVRLEEIGKASAATLDDRYRFDAQSVNLTWPLCVRRSLRPITDESEMKTEVKSLFGASSLWGAMTLAIYRAKTRIFFASAQEYFYKF